MKSNVGFNENALEIIDMGINMSIIKNLRLLLLGSFSLLSVKESYAQQKILGLKDALQEAEKSYPLLKARQLYVSSSEESLMAARLEYMPALKLHGQVDYSTANSLAGTYFPYGVVVPISGAINPSNDSRPVYGSIGLAYFEWSPFSFGQYRSRVNIAKAGLAVANAAYENEKFQNSARVADAYLAFMTFYRLRIAQEKDLRRALSIQTSVRATVAGGLKPGVDSSFAAAEVSKARLSFMEAQKKENAQREFLANLMGSQELTFIPDTLSFFEKVPVLAAPSPIDIKSHPLLKYYKASEEVSVAREKYIYRSYLPKISLLAGAWGRGSGISPLKNGENNYTLDGGIGFTRYNYALGIACTFNIIDYPRINAEAKAEKFQARAYMVETQGLSLELQNQSLLADQNLDLAILQAREAPVQLQAAKATYQQKLTMYNNGLANMVDLAQALYNLSRAESDAAISYNGAWRALLFKAAAAGDLTIFTSQF